jgi:hypothetical protein
LADCSALIHAWMVFPIGSRRPDFVCVFKGGTLGVFKANGTTGISGDIAGALTNGKLQTADIGATDTIKYRVVVGAAFGGDSVGAGSPGPNDAGEATSPLRKNLTADIVKKAAIDMQTLRLSATSLIKGGKETAPLMKGGAERSEAGGVNDRNGISRPGHGDNPEIRRPARGEAPRLVTDYRLTLDFIA